MGKILLIEKKVLTQAVQINSPEEDEVVRRWLGEMFKAQLPHMDDEAIAELAELQDLAPITDAGGWFARDGDEVMVYIIDPETFEESYNVVESQELAPPPESEFKIVDL
jgi:hypothetical protein